MRAIQFMGSVSQPIIAAIDQLVVYSPLLRGLFIYLTLFTQFTGSPRRLYQTKPPSQADRQLSLLRRRVASYHSFAG